MQTLNQLIYIVLKEDLHFTSCQIAADSNPGVARWELSAALAGFTVFRTWLGAAKPFIGSYSRIISISRTKIFKNLIQKN